MAVKLKVYCFVIKGKWTITCPELEIVVREDNQFDAESQFCTKMAEALTDEEMLNTRVKFKWI
jgi:hypothetical protein